MNKISEARKVIIMLEQKVSVHKYISNGGYQIKYNFQYGKAKDWFNQLQTSLSYLNLNTHVTLNARGNTIEIYNILVGGKLAVHRQLKAFEEKNNWSVTEIKQ